MNTRIQLTALAAGLLCISAAYAQTPPDANSLFKQLDTNGNGQLSATELARMPQVLRESRLKAVDTNGDGKIEKSEFMAAAQARAERRFKRMDRNGDGVIEQSEMQPPEHHHQRDRMHDDHQRDSHPHRGFNPDRMLLKMDLNHDGSVSQSEFDSALARWRAHYRAMPKPGDSDSQNQH